MKSVRLTKDIRNRILNSYIACYKESNPEPQKYTQEKITDTFAEKLRQRIFKNAGVDETKIPSNFFNTSSGIRVQLPDGTVRAVSFYNFEEDNYISYSYRPCPLLDGCYPIETDDPDYLVYKKELRELKEKNKAHEDYANNFQIIKDQVRMALDSVNTTGQLLSVWPEAERFIPSDVLDFSTIQLPSVAFSSLNKAVGI